MKKTIFEITRMDCPSEENLIRIKLSEFKGIEQLSFDIPGRKLSVFHQSEPEPIIRTLDELNLGSRMLSSENTSEPVIHEHSNQRRLLWTVLAVNFAFFIIEMSTGLISGSMGLVADSLDMLADAFVYGISLLAVGSTLARKKMVASVAGYFQLILAISGFAEVMRRFLGGGDVPDFTTMIVVSAFALMANAYCLYLLQKSKSREEAHMRASLIFTSNDVIINLGVIVAGALVLWLDSGIPDLIIGALVFVLVIQGAIRILKLGR
jgi:Co/Zn/Cd efflux system component